MPGRPAKPLKIHALDGTFRADRHVRKNVAGGHAPEQPKGLDPTARAMWRHVVATRGDWLAESDGPALQSLCENWSLRAKALKALASDPTDKITRASYIAYHQECKRLFACFGMTPTDRAKLGEQTESEHDPAAEFIA
jgi:phage terminase small subunit